MSVEVSVSILSSDLGDLRNQIIQLEKAGADMIHFDIMDGVFVPNLTFGAPILSSLRKHTKLRFDAHLMVVEPEKHIEAFAKAGADLITIHQEAFTHLDRILSQIKSHGIKAGIALNPSTHESTLEYVWDQLDLILVMSVNPGFAGQSFLNSQIPKIANLKRKVLETGRDIKIAVDGGISEYNITKVKEAGADIVISASYIFEQPHNYSAKIKSLKV